MGFVVAAESASRPDRTLTSELRPLSQRGVRLDRQVSQLCLVGMLSAQRFIH